MILFTALGEKGISAKAETSEKEEVKEQIEEKRNRIRNAYFPEADVADRSAKEDVDVQSAEEAKTVYVECGRVIYYSGYSTNYFEAEGNSAWCLEPARGTPQSGNYTAVKLEILLILQGHYIILLLLPVKRHCINGTEVKGTGRSGM